MDRFTRIFSAMLPASRQRDLDCIRRNKQTGTLHTLMLKSGPVELYCHLVDDPCASLIFELHGGGMVLGHGLQNDAFCEALSLKANVHVVSVDYLEAPEHPYPAAIDQLIELLRAVQEGRLPELTPRKLLLLGFSGGATIATAAALRCNARREGPHIDGLLLHYPFLDASIDPADKPGTASNALPVEVARAFNQLYADEALSGDPCVSPLLAEDELLRALPFTALFLAENDFLCDEGKRFAQRLMELHVPVLTHLFPDVCHGYVEDCFDEALYLGRGGIPQGPGFEAMRRYGLQALEETARAAAMVCGA